MFMVWFVFYVYFCANQRLKSTSRSVTYMFCEVCVNSISWKCCCFCEATQMKAWATGDGVILSVTAQRVCSHKNWSFICRSSVQIIDWPKGSTSFSIQRLFAQQKNILVIVSNNTHLNVADLHSSWWFTNQFLVWYIVKPKNTVRGT